ncbi:flagellar hook-length control protein [Yersinia pseudotuberculosis]|uniref:flagellar hook-length control protein FliK n=1 Tax=Yersinia pseudotuberculosis TaxID=633 RepID=UPI0005AD61C6|nr:flagellar hook-length control protein FliK [Yersinia pseudotuberculosis]AJK14749.1 flagellar hook-length control FliK family protein [Yersinia pseudotuberculosis str. PA3606]CNG54838.1 flagellar hook-length control protein [Yersinia pseudotuberculosis]CNL63254.1 flagellar hook-length control protein [Yersinia pseudotuberculosis]CNL80265.1 flagellar hook-length control protein [Yersinia pseudotuberculosis]CRY72991.1 flagellar hook-length control protein [Yersinia pseudotuberculosis]
MITLNTTTLNTLSQVTDSFAPTKEEIKVPATARPEGVSVGSLANFDAVLSQALVPHQPISLSPAAVEEVIAAFDAEGTVDSHEADLTLSADEQNQQLLDALLQTQPANVSPMALKPTVQSQAFQPVRSEGEQPTPLSDSVPVSLSTPKRSLTQNESLFPLLRNGPSASQVQIDSFVPVNSPVQIDSPAQIDSHVQIGSPVQSGNVPSGSNETSTASRIDSPLTLANNRQEWPQQLRMALGERLQVQADSRVQHATIRLDPPDMGKIDISIHFEGGKLQVNINANQGEVYRALQQSSAELRQTLIGQNSAEVNVQVSANSQQQQQQRHPSHHGQADILAAQHFESQAEKNADDGTLLITI